MFKPYKKKNTPLGDVYFIHESELDFLVQEIVKLNSYLPPFLKLRSGDVIFDVGANIGIFSLHALAACQFKATIYSFEPILNTFQCLSENIRPYERCIHIFNAGMGNPIQDRLEEFSVFANQTLTSSYRPKDKLISNYQPFLDPNRLLKLAKGSNKFLYYALVYFPFLRTYLAKMYYKKRTSAIKTKCMVSSLGCFITQHGIERVDLVKIDVEGAEFDVLKGIDVSQFALIKQFCIEVHDIDGRVMNMERFLKGLGYNTVVERNPILAELGLNHHMIYAFY